VQKDKRFVWVAMSLICLSAAPLAGCRSTASPLAEATAKAGRLYDRACSLLNDTPYMIGDKYAPFPADFKLPSDSNEAAKQVRLTDLGHVNPQADEALNEAIDGLTKALGAAAEGQPEIEKIHAQSVLARLYAMRGYRMSLSAGLKRRQAWDAAGLVDDEAVRINGLGKRIASYDQILSVTDESPGNMAEAAKKQLAAAVAKMADANTATAALEKEEAELKAANVKLFGDSRKLLVDSQFADPIKGVEIFNEAKTKEDQAGVNSARLAQIDESKLILKSQLAEFDAARVAAASQVAAAGKLADDRQKSRTETEQARKAQVDKLTEAQQRLEVLAGQIVQLSKVAAADEAKAVGDYDKAVNVYELYEKTTGSYAKGPDADAFLKPDPAIVAMLGDVLMARADLRVQALLLQRRLDAVVAEISGIWSALPTRSAAPASIAQMKDYVPNVGKMREDAQRDFNGAATAYEKATAAVKNPKFKWAYVLQQSAAGVGLYRLSGDAEAKKKATEALDSLDTQEASPLIAPTAGDFRRLLSGPALLLGSEAPSSSPAEAPAATSAPASAPAAS